MLNESLRSYVNHLFIASNKVDNVHLSIFMHALSELKRRFVKGAAQNRPRSFLKPPSHGTTTYPNAGRTSKSAVEDGKKKRRDPRAFRNLRVSAHQQTKTTAVQITVYVVNPSTANRSAAPNHYRSSGSRHRRRLNQALPATRTSRGYDRKAQLLLYTRQLRALAARDHPPGGDGDDPLQKPKEDGFDNKHSKVNHALQISAPSKTVKEKVNQDLRIPANVNDERRVKEVLQMAARVNAEKMVKGDVPPHKAKEARQIIHATSWKVVPVEHKLENPKVTRPPPSCMGDWKRLLLIPNFLVCAFGSRKAEESKRKTQKYYPNESISHDDKMNAIVMSSKVEQERIGVMAKFLSVFGRANTAEATGALIAMTAAQEWADTMDGIWIEGDSAITIADLHRTARGHPSDKTMAQIAEFFCAFKAYRISHVYRAANRAADFVASFSCFDDTEWRRGMSLPLDFCAILNEDRTFCTQCIFLLL
ncbi:hypothetical protein AXF42_Ash017846 [Apostasia shenzhenica]|uniref:RNase H type-1 domain-containing protein n=1 Tax=Apostasia shenzhenica TaxID=1088818 RepID=A0A2I0A3Y0_9ASPA|nr:hypothetical protein AXF42_Ash017846 [Apostasia shenzhenica]